MQSQETASFVMDDLLRDSSTTFRDLLNSTLSNESIETIVASMSYCRESPFFPPLLRDQKKLARSTIVLLSIFLPSFLETLSTGAVPGSPRLILTDGDSVFLHPKLVHQKIMRGLGRGVLAHAYACGPPDQRQQGARIISNCKPMWYMLKSLSPDLEELHFVSRENYLDGGERSLPHQPGNGWHSLDSINDPVALVTHIATTYSTQFFSCLLEVLLYACSCRDWSGPEEGKEQPSKQDEAKKNFCLRVFERNLCMRLAFPPFALRLDALGRQDGTGSAPAVGRDGGLLEGTLHLEWKIAFASRPKACPKAVFVSSDLDAVACSSRLVMEKKVKQLFAFFLLDGNIRSLGFGLAEKYLWIAPSTTLVARLRDATKRKLNCLLALEANGGRFRSPVSIILNDKMRDISNDLKALSHHLRAAGRQHTTRIKIATMGAEGSDDRVALPQAAVVYGTPLTLESGVGGLRRFMSEESIRKEVIFFSVFLLPSMYDKVERPRTTTCAERKLALSFAPQMTGFRREHWLPQASSGAADPGDLGPKNIFRFAFQRGQLQALSSRNRREAKTASQEVRETCKSWYAQHSTRLAAALTTGDSGSPDEVGSSSPPLCPNKFLFEYARVFFEVDGFCAQCLQLLELFANRLLRCVSSGLLVWNQALSVADMFYGDLRGYPATLMSGRKMLEDLPSCICSSSQSAHRSMPLLGLSSSGLSSPELEKISSKYSGGMLANRTGTGKTRTLICYALLAAPLVQRFWERALALQTGGGSSSSGGPSQRSSASRAVARTALVVVPDILLGQWERELRTCTLSIGGRPKEGRSVQGEGSDHPPPAGERPNLSVTVLGGNSDVRCWSELLQNMHLPNVRAPSVLVVSCKVLKLKAFRAEAMACAGNFSTFVVDEIHDFHGKKKSRQLLQSCIAISRQQNLSTAVWGASATPYHRILETAELVGFLECASKMATALGGRQDLPPVPGHQGGGLCPRASSSRLMARLYMLAHGVVHDASPAAAEGVPLSGERLLVGGKGQGKSVPSPSSSSLGKVEFPGVVFENVVVEPGALPAVRNFFEKTNALIGATLHKLTSGREDCAKRRRLFCLLERIASDGCVDPVVFLRVIENLCKLTSDGRDAAFKKYFRTDPAPQNVQRVFFHREDSCCVCLEEHHDPTCLSACGHTFCANCILSVAETALSRGRPLSANGGRPPGPLDRLKCPSCRKQIPFPAKVLRGQQLQSRARRQGPSQDLEQRVRPEAAGPSSSPREDRSPQPMLLFSAPTADSSTFASPSRTLVCLDAKLRAYRERINAWAEEHVSPGAAVEVRAKPRKLVVYYKYSSNGKVYAEEASRAFERAGRDPSRVLSAGSWPGAILPACGGARKNSAAARGARNIQNFIAGQGDVIVLPIEKYNSGLDFSQVSDLWVMGYHRVLSKNDQCIGRCQRMGQAFGKVKIVRFMVKNSFDEFIHNFVQVHERVSPTVSNSLLLSHYLLKNQQGCVFFHLENYIQSALLLQNLPSRLEVGNLAPYCEYCHRISGNFFVAVVGGQATFKEQPAPAAHAARGSTYRMHASAHGPTRRTLSIEFLPKLVLPSPQRGGDSSSGARTPFSRPKRISFNIYDSSLEEGTLSLTASAKFLQTVFATASPSDLFLKVLLPCGLSWLEERRSDGLEQNAVERPSASLENLVCCGACRTPSTRPAGDPVSLQAVRDLVSVVSRKVVHPIRRSIIPWRRRAQLFSARGHALCDQLTVEESDLIRQMFGSRASNNKLRRVMAMSKWEVVSRLFMYKTDWRTTY